MQFVKIFVSNLIVLLMITVHPDNALGVDCSKHKIYCSIKKINPKARNAMELSNHIYRYSQKLGTNPLISVAIIAQESMFRNIVAGEDYGIYQFNLKTIGIYSLDKVRILEDLEYATLSHVKLLKRKIRYCKNKFKNPWVCYHSATPKYADEYEKRVLKYYRRIKDGQ